MYRLGGMRQLRTAVDSMARVAWSAAACCVLCAACGGVGTVPPHREPDEVASTPAEIEPLPEPRRLAVGPSHACYAEDSEVYCWGDPSMGALGHIVPAIAEAGVTPPLYLPEPVAMTGLVAGNAFTCGRPLADPEAVVCFGNAPSEDPEETAMQRVARLRRGSMHSLETLRGATRLAAADGNVCGVLHDGRVRCTGGPLWDMRRPISELFAQVSEQDKGIVDGVDDATAVALSESHGCALRVDGRVVCWGQNDHGQLGGGDTEPQDAGVVRGLNDAVDLAVGAEHTCAIRTDRTVACWGRGEHGQLGQGAFESSALPVAVDGLDDVEQLALGVRHTCALRLGGDVVCWGEGVFGQLGNGASDYSLTPVPVNRLHDVREIAASMLTTCAVAVSAELHCWGLDGRGETGARREREPVVRTRVGIDNAVEVAVNTEYACARTRDGRVSCWGYGVAGRLGNGRPHSSRVPVEVPGLSGVTRLDIEQSMACALTDDDRLLCWGRVGSVENSPPSTVADIPVRDVALAGLGGCVLDDRGRPHCWASRGPASAEAGIRLEPVEGVAESVSLTGFFGGFCTAHRNGQVSCWSQNLLRPPRRDAPSTRTGIRGAVAVTGGALQTCAVLRDRTVRCWRGDDDDARTAALRDVSSVTCEVACCAIASGALHCWTDDPTRVAAEQDAATFSGPGLHRLPADDPVAVDVSGLTVCWVERGGSVRCQGPHNTNGQLGAVTSDVQPVPVRVARPARIDPDD